MNLCTSLRTTMKTQDREDAANYIEELTRHLVSMEHEISALRSDAETLYTALDNISCMTIEPLIAEEAENAMKLTVLAKSM